MSYQKYVGVIALLLFLAAALHMMLFYFNIGVPPKTTRHMHNFVQKKEACAESVPGRKIMVVAASGTALGVDAGEIEKELKIPTVNFGFTMPLHRYIFVLAKKGLHDGDIVVLPLEYTLYLDNPYNMEYMPYIMAYDYLYFEDMKFTEKLRFIFAVDTYSLAKGVYYQLRPEPDRKQEFKLEQMDARGDRTPNFYDKDHINVHKLWGEVTPYIYPLATNVPSTEAQEVLRGFAEYCKAHHIQLYVTWPTLLRREASLSNEDAENLQKIAAFWTSCGVEVLGEPDEAFYEIGDYYDHATHLNQQGKEKYTRHLVDLLREKI